MNYTLKSFEITSFNEGNQSFDFFVQFDKPNILGLNFEKSDKLVFVLNESYDITRVL